MISELEIESLFCKNIRLKDGVKINGFVRCNNDTDYRIVISIVRNSGYKWVGGHDVDFTLKFGYPIWIGFRDSSKEISWTVYPATYLSTQSFIHKYCEVEK